jgi:hypothetical protein
MTETEEKRLKEGIPRETISVERIWNKRPNGFTIKLTTTLMYIGTDHTYKRDILVDCISSLDHINFE